MEQFIQHLANSYFWIILIIIIIQTLSVFLPKSKEEKELEYINKKSKASRGEYNSINLVSILVLTMWIVSMYYK